MEQRPDGDGGRERERERRRRRKKKLSGQLFDLDDGMIVKEQHKVLWGLVFGVQRQNKQIRESSFYVRIASMTQQISFSNSVEIINVHKCVKS